MGRNEYALGLRTIFPNCISYCNLNQAGQLLYSQCIQGITDW